MKNLRDEELIFIEKIPRIFLIKFLSEDKKYSTIEPKTESECKNFFLQLDLFTETKKQEAKLVFHVGM